MRTQIDVLARREFEIRLPDGTAVVVRVISVGKSRVRLGITAPASVSVRRSEVPEASDTLKEAS